MAGKLKRGRPVDGKSSSPSLSEAKLSAAAAKRAEKRRVKAAAEEDEPEEMGDIEQEVADQSSDEAPEDSGTDDDDEEDGKQEKQVDFSKLVGVGDTDEDDVEGDMEMMALSDLPSQIVTNIRNDEAALEKKLFDIGLFTGGQDGTEKGVFWDSLCVTMPLNEELEDKLALDDLEREQKFAEMATAAAHIGLERLRREKVKFRRPTDYFAEMVKTDDQMSKVKARILHEKERIDAAEKRRHNREMSKNRKKVRSEQMAREQEKKRKAKEEIETIHRLRKQRLKERAEAANNGEGNSDGEEFPIDVLEVEQLDDENRFWPQKEVASGKRKAWSGSKKTASGAGTSSGRVKKVGKKRLGKGRRNAARK